MTRTGQGGGQISVAVERAAAGLPAVVELPGLLFITMHAATIWRHLGVDQSALRAAMSVHGDVALLPEDECVAVPVPGELRAQMSAPRQPYSIPEPVLRRGAQAIEERGQGPRELE